MKEVWLGWDRFEWISVVELRFAKMSRHGVESSDKPERNARWFGWGSTSSDLDRDGRMGKLVSCQDDEHLPFACSR